MAVPFDQRGSEPEQGKFAVWAVEPASGHCAGRGIVRDRHADPHRREVFAALGRYAATVDETGAGKKPAQGRAVGQSGRSANHGARQGEMGLDALGQRTGGDRRQTIVAKLRLYGPDAGVGSTEQAGRAGDDSGHQQSKVGEI